MSASETSIMRYDPRKEEAVSSSRSQPPGMIGLSARSSVILIGWPVVLINSCLILFRSRSVPMGWLFDASFHVLLFGLNTLALTASLIINEHSEANFFLGKGTSIRVELPTL